VPASPVRHLPSRRHAYADNAVFIGFTLGSFRRSHPPSRCDAPTMRVTTISESTADPSLVKEWLKTKFPKIKKAAETLGADIYCGDAAHIRSDHHAGRTWGKKGETPIVVTTGARHGMSLLSAITSKGHMRFMIKEKRRR
jgi:hypothetical protein